MSGTPATPLLEVRDLAVSYPASGGGLVGRRGRVRAVDAVSFQVRRGETLGLVGESGCGKSTTARAVLGLLKAEAGSVRFDGQEVRELRGHDLNAFRRRVQLVFQDPYDSLNPRLSVEQAIREVLMVHGLGGPDPGARVAQLLDLVGLSPEHAGRFPHEFSGGQRQRIGIARALAVEPELLILDEPVSALDVSVRAQVLNLLRDLQDELGLTYLFIAHDLSVVEHVSDTIAVMYLGRMVEVARSQDLRQNPRHPYTRALLSAVPEPDPSRRDASARIVLQGDVPDPSNPPAGCAFHPRCPHPGKDDVCRTVRPVSEAVGEGHFSACPKGPEGP